MIEGIFLAAILIVAVGYIIRPWYRAFTGKEQGCANCPGCYGQGRSCSHTQVCPGRDSDVHEEKVDQSNKSL